MKPEYKGKHETMFQYLDFVKLIFQESNETNACDVACSNARESLESLQGKIFN